jgi:hypothetical protein
MRDYLILHLDTKASKGTACSKKGYRCNEHERQSNITQIKSNQIKSNQLSFI